MKETIAHLEHQLSQLKEHVSQQDAEFFRLAKRVDALVQRMKKLEDRLEATGGQSPVEEDPDLPQKPPHY